MKLKITSNRLKWLWGGLGFHNSEATMTPIMGEDLKNERIIKTFLEISPTYSRVFAGYANWTREAMDSFADYYDATFRKAGTTLYLVPGRMPYITDAFDMEAYCEQVAKNLAYLIQVRKCKKIRHYCVTNELSVGNTYSFFADKLDLLKEIHQCLYKAFRRHGLDVGLLATDCSGVENYSQITWATEHMDEITECYCAHLYHNQKKLGDLNDYAYFVDAFTPPVMTALSKEKRFILGEFGLKAPAKPRTTMINDVSYAVDVPDEENLFALSVCEIAMAAINSGCMAAAYWTMIDYPDPFLREDGDTPEEKARYEVARFSGHGLDMRYNKHGLLKWSDAEKDYGSRASLYTMGYMAKLFQKGARVLHCQWEDATIRSCAVMNDDGTVSIAILNWSDQETAIELETDCKFDKPLRKYEYRAQNVPYHPFNDLQSHSALIHVSGKCTTLTAPGQSVLFLTTDYVNRTPSPIQNIRLQDNRLHWDPCTDPEHCYYRVFASNEPNFALCTEYQIASTVAEHTAAGDYLYYKVISVDKYGNPGT